MTTRATSPSFSITIRLRIDNRIGMLAKVVTAISAAGGDIGSVDIVGVDRKHITRDVTINSRNEEHEKEILMIVGKLPGVKIMQAMDRTFTAHCGGKIEVKSIHPIQNNNDLSLVYTPGVARVCRAIEHNEDLVYDYTMKHNAVAIVSDGTAVLGLGDIGPAAAMPVMEGKAALFKEFAGVNAVPIVLSTKDPDEIIGIVRSMATPFGGINLEDISAPRCFEIEERLQKELDIPVFHDDQHGTAVVILAGLMNAGKLLKKDIRKFRVVIAGAGAAGTAAAHLLLKYGIHDVIVTDRAGAVYSGRKEHMNPAKNALAAVTNPRGFRGTLSETLVGAHVFVGVSGPNIITRNDVKHMAKDPIVFALANPDPEIAPEEAHSVARILATGRSDYPNQVNNSLGFPGIFKGLLSVRAKSVNDEIKFAAARAIASVVNPEELNEDYIIPSIFDKKVVHAVSHAVAAAAIKTGVARVKDPLHALTCGCKKL